jgi:hypothetical protein
MATVHQAGEHVRSSTRTPRVRWPSALGHCTHASNRADADELSRAGRPSQARRTASRRSLSCARRIMFLRIIFGNGREPSHASGRQVISAAGIVALACFVAALAAMALMHY